MMTVSPEHDLANYVRFVVEFEDGSRDVLAIPQCTLDQGPSGNRIARIIAYEWQRDGYIKQGKIVGVYPDRKRSLAG